MKDGQLLRTILHDSRNDLLELHLAWDLVAEKYGIDYPKVPELLSRLRGKSQLLMEISQLFFPQGETDIEEKKWNRMFLKRIELVKS